MDARKYSICLSSRSCLDQFSKNTSSKFTNSLPEVLTNRSNKRFYLRLLMVGVCTTRKDELRMPNGYVKIHIYEVEEQREGMSYKNFAGGFPFPPERKCGEDYATHTFINAPNLLLRTQHLSKLRVKLTDEFNKEIEFAYGPPTILWLEVTDMERTQEEFTVVCTSYHPESFPNNTLAEFCSPLPTEMSLRDFEVALLQLVYPSEVKETVYGTLQAGAYTWVYNLSSMASIDDLVAAVNADINGSHFANRLVMGRLAEGDMEGFVYLRQRGALQGRESGPIIVQPSPNFTKACGQVREPRPRTVLQPNSYFIFDGFPDIALGQENPIAMLECDVIKPNMLAGRNANLLHCVPVLANKNAKDNKMYEPSLLAFHPVIDSPFNRLAFRFINPDGTLRTLSTANDKECILMSLLFRKKKQ